MTTTNQSEMLATKERITLNAEQVAGLEKFKEWFESDRPVAHISGSGGSGKTTAIIQYIEYAGIHPSRCIAGAPTHTAALKLSSQLGFKAYSLHHLLKLKPVTQTWDNSRTKEIRQVKGSETIDDTFVQQDAIKHTQETLEFVSNESTFDLSRISLMVIDEISMIDEQIMEEIQSLTEWYPDLKVIGLGDDEQLFPVGESQVSKFFNTPCIVRLSTNMRAFAEGNLAKTIADVRAAKDPSLQLEILSNLPNSNNPSKDAAGMAKSLTVLSQARLLDTLSEGAQDGLSYRFLAYTNDSVDRYAKLCQEQVCQGDYYRKGDLLVARSSISYGLKKSTFTTLNAGGMVRLGELLAQNRIAGTETMKPVVVNTYKIEYVDLGHSFFDLLHGNDYPIDRLVAVAKGELSPYNLMLPEDWSTTIERFFKGGKPFNYQFDDTSVFDTIRLVDPSSWESFYEIYNTMDKAKRAIVRHDKSRSKTDLSKNDAIASLIKMLAPSLPQFDLAKPAARSVWWHEDQDRLYGDCGETAIRQMLSGCKETHTRSASWGYLRYLDAINMPLAYPQASTIHKSQGATIDTVVLDIANVRNVMKYNKNADEIRRLIYTAVSRASKNLYVIK